MIKGGKEGWKRAIEKERKKDERHKNAKEGRDGIMKERQEERKIERKGRKKKERVKREKERSE